MITKKHILIGLVGITSALVLSACERQTRNPLLLQPKSEVAKFIKNAQAYAVKETGLGKNENLYAACVKNYDYLKGSYGNKGPMPCRTYFNAMISYANTTKNFHGLTIHWLRSDEAYERVEKAFNSIE